MANMKQKFIYIILVCIISIVAIFTKLYLTPSRINFDINHGILIKIASSIMQKYKNKSDYTGYFNIGKNNKISLYSKSNTNSLYHQFEISQPSKGVFNIFIITWDEGHIGVVGYLYSSHLMPVLQKNEAENEYLLRNRMLGSPIIILERISKHWYIAKNDSF